MSLLRIQSRPGHVLPSPRWPRAWTLRDQLSSWVLGIFALFLRPVANHLVSANVYFRKNYIETRSLKISKPSSFSQKAEGDVLMEWLLTYVNHCQLSPLSQKVSTSRILFSTVNWLLLPQNMWICCFWEAMWKRKYYFYVQSYLFIEILVQCTLKNM